MNWHIFQLDPPSIQISGTDLQFDIPEFTLQVVFDDVAFGIVLVLDVGSDRVEWEKARILSLECPILDFEKTQIAL